MTGSYLTGVNLGELRQAIRADITELTEQTPGALLVDACPWTHVLELVSNLLADKTAETTEQFAAVVQVQVLQLDKLIRQYRAIVAKRPVAEVMHQNADLIADEFKRLEGETT